MISRVLKFWQVLRAIAGDDAYERYLAHRESAHGSEGSPMSRKQFFESEIKRRWSGVKRCC